MGKGTITAREFEDNTVIAQAVVNEQHPLVRVTDSLWASHDANGGVTLKMPLLDRTEGPWTEEQQINALVPLRDARDIRPGETRRDFVTMLFDPNEKEGTASFRWTRISVVHEAE